MVQRDEPVAVVEGSFQSGEQRFRSFPLNTLGRDFVVGDIHGAFDLVIRGMRQVGFDRSRDRLFVVGDTVDRGDESIRALQFLRMPCVWSLAGNHERDWLEIYADGPPDDYAVEAYSRVTRKGLEWWVNAKPDDRDALIGIFKTLPLAAEIETSRGMVGLVHGEVPSGMNWQDFKAAIISGDPATEKAALSGRARLKTNDVSGVRGIGRVFVGHTPSFTGLKRLGNVFYMDTGAVFGLMGHADGALTMRQLVCSTSKMVPSKREALVDAVADGAAATPFSWLRGRFD